MGRTLSFIPRHVDAHRAGEALDCLNEAHMVVFHQETERRAMGTATEAVIETLGRTHRKGRRFLVMERTVRLKLASCFFKLNALAYYLYDIGACDQVVNEMLGYQAAHLLC